jgi:MFS transporter, DHA2 family, multidrug resistance protein
MNSTGFPTAQRSPRTPHRAVVAATVLIGTIMAVLDSSIVNVALPSMSGTLGVTIEEITWVITGYMLSQVIVMPMTGMLSARFGRKGFYQFSIALFTIASMLCGVARSLPTMVFFRILQGFGCGVIMTVSQAILRESFPPAEQALAMGLFGVGVVVTPAVGPTLGGWLTDQYSWPWIFYINVPIGILNIFLVHRFIHDPPYLKREKGRIDWFGLALLTLGLGALQLMLEKGESKDWFESDLIVVLAAVAAASLIVFVWQELRDRKPAVQLRLLKNPALASATVLGGVLGMGLFGSIFLLPLFLQRILGYPAMTSGEVLIPRSLAMAVVMPIGGRVYNRIGPRILVLAGLLVSAASFWQFSHLTLQIGFWDLFWPQVWQGVGFGLIFVALTTAGLATIPKPQMTNATGLYNVIRQVFGSVGIAASATILESSTRSYHMRLAEHVTDFSGPTGRFLRGATAAFGPQGLDPAAAHLRALKLLDLSVLRQAAMLAYNHVYALIAILFLLGCPLVFFLKAPKGVVDTETFIE